MSDTSDAQWWDAKLVIDPDTEFTMVGSLAAIKTWAERLAPRIFDHRQYIDNPHRKQWGSGYYWLALDAHEFTEGEKKPVEAYSTDTGKTYPTWEDLVAAETHGYTVTAIITNAKGKSWPVALGLFANRADAERHRNNLRSKWRRDQRKSWPRYPGQTYQWFVRPVWKADPRG